MPLTVLSYNIFRPGSAVYY